MTRKGGRHCRTPITATHEGIVKMRFISWWKQLCVLHEWSKWEQYTEKGLCFPVGPLYRKEVAGKAFPYEDKRQRRQCARCGTTQDELVKES